MYVAQAMGQKSLNICKNSEIFDDLSYSLGFLSRPQKYYKIFHSIWRLICEFQTKKETLSIFMAFLENLNFN